MTHFTERHIRWRDRLRPALVVVVHRPSTAPDAAIILVVEDAHHEPVRGSGGPADASRGRPDDTPEMQESTPHDTP